MTDIMIVGEAWGEKEEEARAPFVGTSGWLLDQMLSAAGISRKDCFLTNVFNLRPRPSNDVKNLCGPKATALAGYPPLQQSKYVRAEYAPELDRLYKEIRDVNPNIILALGATASWALMHTSGIKSIRGSVALTHPRVNERVGRSVKVLPTYHPAAVARQWSLRPIAISDFDKARRHSDTSVYVRPTRHVWIEPTLEDLIEYERLYIADADDLAPDIETAGDQITCIGFSPRPDTAIVVPFFCEDGRSYWATKEEELAAWAIVRRWLEKPSIYQNGLYDMNVLWSKYGIPCPGAAEDTMLLHHAFQPEMEKGLGFLATIYTDEASWKHMRKGMKHD